MRKKIIFVIKEGLELYSDFFSLIEEKNYVTLFNINYKDLFSDVYMSKLSETKLINIVIIIHEGFYKTVTAELNEHLKQIYSLPFKNLLLIYSDDAFYNEHNLLSSSKHIFYLTNEIAFKLQINSFILYLMKVFSESIISMRLHDYITDSFKDIFDSEILKKKNAEIERLNARLEELNKELTRKNMIDSLTDIYNRATIFDFLEQEQVRVKRDLWRMDKIISTNQPSKTTALQECEPLGEFLEHYGVLSLMLIDVDKFKSINDTHGHLVGDDVLRFLGKLFKDQQIFRQNDITGRWGGEEFLVILPNTNAKNAEEPAHKFLKKLAEKDFTGAGDMKFKVTVSIGISQFYIEDESKEDIIKRVDEAMYWAKANGRNRLAIFEELTKKK